MATVEKKPDGPIALMIDVETLALSPRAFVTQVGLCVANVETREYLKGPTNYWLSKHHQLERTIDFDTVRWWVKQDPKVIANVFEAPERPGGTSMDGDRQDRVSPQELFHIVEALMKAHPGMTVWGSPAMFDLPLLTDLWGGRKPWPYNFERDMMTLYKLLDPTGEWQPPDNTMGHDAAADAQWQMEYLFNLLALLRENNLTTPQSA